MKRELLLLRHAEADGQAREDDYHRPLKGRGKRAARRIGIWVAQADLVLDFVVSSPADRAFATAEKACKAMGIAPVHIRKDKCLYLADAQELLKVLADSPAESTKVLLVGHNPGIEDLLRVLTSGDPGSATQQGILPKAAIAHLEFDGEWASLANAQMQLISITRAENLPEDFPFPDAHGFERRPRPAYYYSQSAAIPYRVQNGVVEILIIGSNNNKRWVIPKGIIGPKLNARESAIQETLEEAGVEGEATDTPLGTYTYEKWGGICTVRVYALKVTHILPLDQWKESHRGRKWVSPEQAALRLKEKALAPMVIGWANHLSELDENSNKAPG